MLCNVDFASILLKTASTTPVDYYTVCSVCANMNNCTHTVTQISGINTHIHVSNLEEMKKKGKNIL